MSCCTSRASPLRTLLPATQWRRRPASTRRYTLFLLVVVYTSSFIDRSIINILVQPIKEEFGVSDTAMGFLTGFSFAIFYAGLGLPVAVVPGTPTNLKITRQEDLPLANALLAAGLA